MPKTAIFHGSMTALVTPFNHGVVDFEALRVRLRGMTGHELLAFGKQMRALVYPLTYGADGRPSVSAFSIQLDEARKEQRRRFARRD